MSRSGRMRGVFLSYLQVKVSGPKGTRNMSLGTCRWTQGVSCNRRIPLRSSVGRPVSWETNTVTHCPLLPDLRWQYGGVPWKRRNPRGEAGGQSQGGRRGWGGRTWEVGCLRRATGTRPTPLTLHLVRLFKKQEPFKDKTAPSIWHLFIFFLLFSSVYSLKRSFSVLSHTLLVVGGILRPWRDSTTTGPVTDLQFGVFPGSLLQNRLSVVGVPGSSKPLFVHYCRFTPRSTRLRSRKCRTSGTKTRFV